MKLWWIASIESRRSLLSDSFEFFPWSECSTPCVVCWCLPSSNPSASQIHLFFFGNSWKVLVLQRVLVQHRRIKIVEIIWALDQILGTCWWTCHCLWSGASSSLCTSSFFGLNLRGLRTWHSKQIYNRSIPFFHGQKLRYKRSQLHQYSHNQWHNQHLLLRPGGLESVVEVIIDSSFLPPEAITPQVTRNGIHYREALMDLGKWKKFMATWHWNLGGGWG